MRDQAALEAGTQSAGFTPDRYMPLRKAEIVAAIAADPRLGSDVGQRVAALAHKLSRLFHLEYFERREALKDLYVGLNPDQPGDGPLTVPEGTDAALMAEVRAACEAANFTELDRAEVARAEKQMGRVRATVRVPWGLYDDVTFFVRGRTLADISWRSFFGLRENHAQAVVYDQVVLAARVRTDANKKKMRRAQLRPGARYIKLFRDIPEADLNTLFPDGRVEISLMDKAIIAVPALVGGVPILINIIPALSVLFVVVAAYLGIQGTVEEDHMKQALAALSGLGALVAFLMRQWVKYERQALRYQKQVSDNAHFKNLNNNAGFFDFIVGTSEESEVKEAILAFAFLTIAGGPVPRPELDRRIEEWLKSTFGVTVDFDIDDAVGKLERLGMATEGPEGFTAAPIEQAEQAARAAWVRLAEVD